jgi:hypothetical protein
MKVVISQPMFFPWVGFFEQILLCDTFVKYGDVQFSKGSLTNRVQVKAPEGSRWLTVPLCNVRLGQPINEVEIDNDQDWRNAHFSLLKRCYQTAPYYAEMIGLVESVYSREWTLINDLSSETLMVICRYFGFFDKKEFVNIQDLSIGGSSSERVLATMLKLGANTYITGHGASRYLKHEIFQDAGIEVEYMNYQKNSYPQLYGEFNPYVSILDLISNVGKGGVSLICSSTVNYRDFING